MSTETFADPRVRDIVGRFFELLELNVVAHRNAAAWLGGDGVPEVCVLSLDGRILDRITGYVPPDRFAQRLDQSP